MEAMVESENADIVECMLRKLRDLEPVSCFKVQTLNSDCSKVFYAGWTRVFSDHPIVRIACSWHVEKAWAQNIGKSSNSEACATSSGILSDMLDLRLAPTKEKFDLLFKILEQKWVCQTKLIVFS